MVIAFSFHQESIAKRTKEAITQQLEIIRDNFSNNYQINLKRSLEVLGSSSILDDYLTASKFEQMIIAKKIERLFLQTNKTHGPYRSIRFIDADGNLRISVEGNLRRKDSVNLKQLHLDYTSSVPMSLKASAKLFQTLESIPLLLSGGYMEWFMPPRELQIEGPFIDESGTISVVAGVSKLDIDSRAFGGTLLIHQELEAFFEGLRDVKFFDENLIWVFDAEGKLLQNPEKSDIHLDPVPYLLESFQSTPKLVNVEKGLVAYQDFSVVPGKPFIRVVVSIPEALLLKDFYASIEFFSLVLLSSIGLVFLVALYVSRYLSKPIIELAKAANRLSEGDLTTQVQLQTTGEVQVLVNSFNQMTEELSQTILARDESLAELVKEVAERKRAEQGIRKSEEMLQMTGAMAKVGGWEVDLESMTLIWSEEVYRIHELNPSTRLSLDDSLRFYAAEVQPLVSEALHQCLQNAVGYDMELPFVTAANNHLYVRFLGKAEVKEGKVIRVYGSLQDITEQKHSKDALKRSKEMAEAASHAKSQFLANMSHEIRTPLNSILGFSEILIKNKDRYKFSPKTAAYLDHIHLSGKSLSELVNNILDLTKIESGKMELLLEEVNLPYLLQEVYDMAHIQAQAKQIDYQLQLHSSLMEGISTDGTKLRQVLLNLVGNAIKFTPKHQAVYLTGATAGKHIVIQVIDHGIGVPEANRDQIFESFVQADSTITRRFGGTGLGLTISKKIIDLLNGTIEVSDTPGGGATFSVKIPAIPASPPEIETIEKIQEVIFAKDSKVLIVEDNLINQEMIKAIFEDIGCCIYIAQNGQEGITKTQELHSEGHAPDLILMDMHMPIMGGIDATREIRAYPELRDIPIVALSADAFTEQQIGALSMGMDAYLTKPINTKKLLPILKKYLPHTIK